MAEAQASEIRRIQTFGAQCSGTNWVNALMGRNYPDVDIMRTDIVGGSDNFGWKHGPLGKETIVYVDGEEVKHLGGRIVWERRGIDIPDSDPRYAGRDPNGGLYMKNNALPLNNNNSSDVLLVVVARNPISWLQSYHQKPHHALEMYGLSFGEYIRKRPFRQYQSVHLGVINADSPEARAAREYWIGRSVILDSDESVFDHRSRSLNIFHALAGQVQNVAFVPYERALADPQGTLTEIAGVYDIQMKPDFEHLTAYKRHGNRAFTGSKYAPVEPEDLEYAVSHFDWGAESTAGFRLQDAPSSYVAEQLADPASLVQIDPRIRCYKLGALVVGNC